MIHLLTVDFPPSFDGGIASWALDLAQALHDSHEKVLVYSKATGMTGTYDQVLDFDVHRVPGRSWQRYKSVLLPIELLPRVKKGRDVVLFATWDIAWIAGPALARAGVDYAVAFHGSDLTQLNGPAVRLKRALKGAKALFPVSGFLNEQLRERGFTGTVLPMPLPIADAPAPRLGEGLLVVARLNQLKGVERVFRIAKQLGKPVRVIGDGPAKTALEVEALRLDLDVDFVGKKARVRVLDAYRDHEACLLLPRTAEAGQGAEGLGLVLLEAQGQGVPAIGCATGGVPEAVGGGLLLDDPDDAVKSAGQIEAFLDTQPGPKGWEWVQDHHGPERCLQVLNQALA